MTEKPHAHGFHDIFLPKQMKPWRSFGSVILIVVLDKKNTVTVNAINHRAFGHL